MNVLDGYNSSKHDRSVTRGSTVPISVSPFLFSFFFWKNTVEELRCTKGSGG